MSQPQTQPLITVDRQTVKKIRQALGESVDSLSLANRYKVLLRAADNLAEWEKNNDNLLILVDLFEEKADLEKPLAKLVEAHEILRAILTATDECLPKVSSPGVSPGVSPGGFGTVSQNNQLNQSEKPSNALLSVVSTNWKPSRVKRHAALLQAIAQGKVTVTLHDANEALGFPYLDVVAPLPERLNKPKEQLIGQSCLSVDPRIGEPRFHALKKALASGQCENYHYTYDDDFHWEFGVTVAPIYGSEEVITIVSDAAGWQLGHWLNKLK